MGKNKNDLLQGTLDLLILKVLASDAKLHGWDISKRIQVVSNGKLLVKQGSLYPAVHRLEQKNWIEAEWGVSDAGRSAKFYQLTAQGRRQLEEETSNWQDCSLAGLPPIGRPASLPRWPCVENRITEVRRSILKISRELI